MRGKLLTLVLVLAACGGNGATTTTGPAGSTTAAAAGTTTSIAATTTTLNTDPVDIVAVAPIPLVMADFANAPAPDLGVTMSLVTASPLKGVFVAHNGFPGDCLGFTLWSPDFTSQFVNGHVGLTPDGCDGAEIVFVGEQILLQDDYMIVIELGDIPGGPFIPQFQLLDAGFQTGFYSRPLLEPLDPEDIQTLGTRLFTFFGGGTFDGTTDGVWESYPLPEGAPGTCVPEGSVVCLNNNRFKVEVSFDSGGIMTPANPVTPLPTVGDTGFFWFFDPENVDAVVKVLNGCSTNDHYWVFASSLTGLQGTITIEDTVTGESRSYDASAFEVTGDTPIAETQIADTRAFDTCP